MVLATKTEKDKTEIIINKPCHYLNLKHCEDINTTNKTKPNYVTIIIEIKKFLKMLLPRILKKKPQKTAFPESQFQFIRFGLFERPFLICSETLCSKIGQQTLPYAPCRYLVHKTYDRKNHSSALNENTYLFHQHFSKTKLHIIIYF